MVSVLAFDLGGVLFCDGTKEFVEYLHRTFYVAQARADELLNGALGSSYREGRLTRNEFWSTFRRTLELPPSEDDLESRWIGGYRRGRRPQAEPQDL